MRSHLDRQLSQMTLVFSLEVGVQVMGDYLEKDLNVSQFSISVVLDVSVSTSTGRSYSDPQPTLQVPVILVKIFFILDFSHLPALWRPRQQHWGEWWALTFHRALDALNNKKSNIFISILIQTVSEGKCIFAHGRNNLTSKSCALASTARVQIFHFKHIMYVTHWEH